MAEANDHRFYVPQGESWQGCVKKDSTSDNCYYKADGEEFFHRLVVGEIYLQRGTEKCCLNCALKHGIITRDRMHWKKSD